MEEFVLGEEKASVMVLEQEDLEQDQAIRQ